MDTELRLSLEHFKECSLEIVNIVEREAYEELEGKIAERQVVIDKIDKLSFNENEISQIFKDLELTELAKKINEIINNKKTKLKAEMQENAVKKNANTNYSRILNSNFHVFSKKV